MSSESKSRRRLTPLQRLVNTSLGKLMSQRLMVARHGKLNHGLKLIETVVLAHVRLSDTQGKLHTATTLADEVSIDRKSAERMLKKLVKGSLVVPKERGKEVTYKSPDDYVYPAYLIEDMIRLVADQIALGDRLKLLVSELEDEDLKSRITKAVDAVKMTAFGLTSSICLGKCLDMCRVVEDL